MADGLRAEMIRAREALPAAERDRLSLLICRRIAASPEYARAKTVLLYRGVRGEVRLTPLEAAAESAGKRLLFPLCLPEHQMAALLPEGPEAWHTGYCGIPEPSLSRSTVIAPADIDLVICPCTAFDEALHRMGMGGGFYDRYLPLCTHAVIAAAAFELQNAASIEKNPWDVPMDLVFTETSIYRKAR